MVNHELHEDEGILIVQLEGALSKEDFEALGKTLDPWLEQNGKLRGLMICTRQFPGWAKLTDMVAHIRFVKTHHHYIEKVAAVTDSNVLGVVPHLARFFVNARLKHFRFEDRDKAFAWLKGESLDKG
jgi:hypothetical protein